MSGKNDITSFTVNSEIVEYDPKTGTYEADYDWSDSVTPSTAVLETTATIDEVDPIDLDPLYDSIDPDILDALFDSSSARTVTCVTFIYAGNEVTVHGDGTVKVRNVEKT